MNAIISKKLEHASKLEIYSEIIRKQGHEIIANKLLEISKNEKEHVKLLFESKKIDLKKLLTEFSNTENELHNLKDDSINRKIAEKISDIDAIHEKTILMLLKDLNENRLHKKDYFVNWKCSKCGFTNNSKESPKKCPLCNNNRFLH